VDAQAAVDDAADGLTAGNRVGFAERAGGGEGVAAGVAVAAGDDGVVGAVGGEAGGGEGGDAAESAPTVLIAAAVLLTDGAEQLDARVHVAAVEAVVVRVARGEDDAPAADPGDRVHVEIPIDGASRHLTTSNGGRYRRCDEIHFDGQVGVPCLARGIPY